MAFDVLLTYPKEKVNAFYNMIPLGIAHIASVLEQNDYKVNIIDFNFYKGDFKRDLRKWNPKIVGIGGTTVTRKGSFLTAKSIKEVLPDVPVVYGGVHASFTAEDTLKHIREINYIVKGEDEFTFLFLCNFFTGRNEKPIYDLPGLSYRKENGLIHNKTQRINNLDQLPLPARHLFDKNIYRLKLDFYDIEADFIMTSRGCPNACSFCSASKMFPGGALRRSTPHIQTEIEYILSHKNIRALKLFDSTFTSSKNHVLNFCKMIKPYNLLWECEVRADTVDFELLKIMKDAGCCYIDVGLETTDANLLESINKKITVHQVENVLLWSKKLGIRTKVFFIFGHLKQTYQSCLNDVAYIKKNQQKIDFYATTVGMRIYPGTTLEKKVKEAHLMPKNFSWAKFKPSKWNYLLYEFDDQFILNQKQLDYKKLFKIILLLAVHGNIGSWGYIKYLLLLNLIWLLSNIELFFIHSYHKFKRKAKNCF